MPHDFLIDDLQPFISELKGRGYAAGRLERFVYEKSLSGAVVKRYAIFPKLHGPVRVRVSYDLPKGGGPLRRLTKALKDLNRRYRASLDMWKTRRGAPERARQRTWEELQRFLAVNRELVECFRYTGDPRATEGRRFFTLQVPSTPEERRACMAFIEALAESEEPHSIRRGRRRADASVGQRNAWIRRFTREHRKRGWPTDQILRRIQKELRDGTWNERSRLQYNIAENTIGKIAGLKPPRFNPN